jgi:hypothetical protein
VAVEYSQRPWNEFGACSSKPKLPGVAFLFTDREGHPERRRADHNLFGEEKSSEFLEKLQDHFLEFDRLLKVNHVTALLDHYEARVRNSSVDLPGLLP